MQSRGFSMSIATVENNVARPMYARRMPQSPVAVNADPVATPACAPHVDPLARIAALLVSISRNNGYEGRDPSVMPDALTSGFVADLIGVDIDELATLLLDLSRRGLVESGPSNLTLKDIPGLERLAN
jgi:hypothetical protein